MPLTLPLKTPGSTCSCKGSLGLLQCLAVPLTCQWPCVISNQGDSSFCSSSNLQEGLFCISPCRLTSADVTEAVPLKTNKQKTTHDMFNYPFSGDSGYLSFVLFWLVCFPASGPPYRWQSWQRWKHFTVQGWAPSTVWRSLWLWPMGSDWKHSIVPAIVLTGSILRASQSHELAPVFLSSPLSPSRLPGLHPYWPPRCPWNTPISFPLLVMLILLIWARLILIS